MNKTTKGALAAAAAGVLLLGGAGTLAYWTDTATVTGTDINSGHLKLTESACDATWILDDGDPLEVPFTGQLLVPGDTLSRTCTYTVDAAGQHIEAELAIDKDPSFVTGSNAALLEELDVSGSTMTLEGDPVTSGGTPVVVEDDDVVVVNYVVEWPFGDAANNNSNISTGLTATLESIVLTLTQTNPHA